MKKVFHPKNKIQAATGTLEDFIMAVEDRIDQLESGDVESSTFLEPEDLENVDDDSAIFASDEQNSKYQWNDFISNYWDWFGFEGEEEFSDWIEGLILDAGYKTNEVEYFIDYGVDNPSVVFTDGTVWDITGNYGNDYLVESTGMHEDIESSSSILAEDALPRGYYDDYFGQTEYEEWGDIVSEKYSGMIISKNIDDAEKPGGIQYEAEKLGMDDLFVLLRCLEGMCYNGKAVEISDYQYKVN